MLTIFIEIVGAQAEVYQGVLAAFLCRLPRSCTQQDIIKVEIIIHLANAVQVLQLVKERNANLADLVLTEDAVVVSQVRPKRHAHLFHSDEREMIDCSRVINSLRPSLLGFLMSGNGEFTSTINFGKV